MLSRISLHCLENYVNFGLIRVDFGNFGKSHPNPVDILPTLPHFFYEYAGMKINVSHIHFHVEGYKQLGWALPLTDYENFKTKNITNNLDFKESLCDFAKEINLIEEFIFPTLKLFQ